ncbi:MAG: alpha-amylase family glycosyl hydrolase [Treponematales bacterium]
MPEWLESAVFYEVYPQSFFDSNGDGIGDIPGIIQKLDYIRALGCSALWLNPCFDSPFKDAGYDVRDYRLVAARYGTNEDLFRLFDEAHARGMRVLLDLVPGHTSEEHRWFTASARAEPPEEFKNRYIWTDSWVFWGGVEGLRFIAGEAERDGCYIINFFKCQPSLNYGFLAPKEPWQLPVNHPDCLATREAVKDIMRFWLRGDRGRGCDGFRVDMADSLVKFDDANKSGTQAVWRDIREMLDREFPEAALVSEWSAPDKSLAAGFHADFLLDYAGSCYRSLVRDYRTDARGRVESGGNRSFFCKDGGGIERFLRQYLPWYEAAARNGGYISLITGNHDTARIGAGLSGRELALAYAFLFTMPGAPFLYYGDEIGMRRLPGLASKEGGYTRTGSRTPMQWTRGANAGFSTAPAEALYLPVDTAPDAPSVEAQERDPASLLNTVRALLRLRAAERDLQAAPNLTILHPRQGAGDEAAETRALVYRRGAFVLGVNPAGEAVSISVPEARGRAAPVYTMGRAALENGLCSLDAQSFGAWRMG